LGQLPFALFISLLIFLALWELTRMADQGGYATQSWWGIGVGVLLMVSLVFPGIKTSIPFVHQGPALVLMAGIFILTLREMIRRDKSLSMLRMAVSFLGLFFVVWPLGHMILLRDLRGVGRDGLFFLVAIIWVQDITAWAAGLSFGKRRLAPVISAKKSWEGAIAGLLGALLAGLLMREFALPDLFSRREALVLSLVLGVLAQVSDLAESLLKRCFGVKDSSNLLPGHGGVLDRFDSFLFSTPFLYFYLVLTGK
jgi:phosphatidate cytidylyltransferase